MTPRRISLVRDCRGASAAEFAIVLPLLLILIFGVIDGGRFLWEVNRAEKATQVGVRMAVVTTVLAPGLISEDYTVAGNGRPAVKSGELIPAAYLGRLVCNSAGCTCATAPCPTPGALNTTTFNAIVDRMRTIDPTLTNANVVVTYSGSGLGTAGEGGATATGGVVITAAESGRHGLHLIKLTGSSFTRFLRDEFTTLPETVDRPLYIHLDVHWKYADLGCGLGEDLPRYVHAEQVRDFVHAIFDGFNSRSIQHLVDEIGQRMLERFPQLAEVRFDAQNRTWETVKVSERDPKVKVYTDPHATFGKIGLVLRR